MQGIAQTCVRVRQAPYLYEHMFSSLKHITDKAADALDLAIELVTLGEYGLEYPDSAMPEAIELHRSAPSGDCRGRGRINPSKAERRKPTPRPNRRPGNPAVPSTRPSRPLSPGSPADIIRTPRIQPDWTRV